MCKFHHSVAPGNSSSFFLRNWQNVHGCFAKNLATVGSLWSTKIRNVILVWQVLYKQFHDSFDKKNAFGGKRWFLMCALYFYIICLLEGVRAHSNRACVLWLLVTCMTIEYSVHRKNYAASSPVTNIFFWTFEVKTFRHLRSKLFKHLRWKLLDIWGENF